jgi:hypothetical protein
MWTGRQTLASIERVSSDLHGEEGRLDVALRLAVSEAARLRKERSAALQEFARVKLDEMEAGRLMRDLAAGERRALHILESYRQRIATTTERREALQPVVTGAETRRHAAATVMENALEMVEALRADAEARVQTTPAWQAAKTALDEAAEIASEADKKANQSETELGAKKKPYDGDALFTYLWRRNYATSRYSAGSIARLVDRTVADFIGFDDARVNYGTLIETPLRLREHATAKRTAEDERKTALSEVERGAMLEAGVDIKEQALAEARHTLAVADADVEHKHALLRELDAEHAVLVDGGHDAAYNEALATIASADSAVDLATLYKEARQTPTSADVAIVRRLETIDASIAKVDAEIGKLRDSAQDLARRRTDVEQARDRFRNAGYDHPHATFGNEHDLASVLKGILTGAAAGGTLWDTLQNGYGYRAPRGRPDFGYPNFPFPFPIPGGGNTRSPGGGWREPTSRGGWSPTHSPSPGGARAGRDFSTGGSF